MRLTNLILIFAIIAVAGTGVFAQNERIFGIQWTLVEANGRKAANSNAYFEIEPDQKRFSGNTGCNTMTGSVDVRSDRITFSPVATTRRACKMIAGSVPEETFLKFLGRAAKFRRQGNNLSILDRGGRVVLRFQRLVKQPPVDPAPDNSGLNGQKWVLEQIKNRQTFVPIKGVFMTFNETKGSVGGNTSCNAFGGEYTTRRDSRISITNVISTMRACIEDSKMSVEREFLEGLRLSDRYEIRDGRLRLFDGNRLMLTFRGEAGS